MFVLFFSSKTISFFVTAFVCNRYTYFVLIDITHGIISIIIHFRWNCRYYLKFSLIYMNFVLWNGKIFFLYKLWYLNSFNWRKIIIVCRQMYSVSTNSSVRCYKQQMLKICKILEFYSFLNENWLIFKMFTINLTHLNVKI